MCIADWVVIATKVSAAPSEIDYSDPASVLHGKRICNAKQLSALSVYPPSLLVAMELCMGEIAQGLGHFNAAKQSFDWVIRQGYKPLSVHAAYRVITLIDDMLWEFGNPLGFSDTPVSHSPFELLFDHRISNASLDQEIFALEQERELLEQTLIESAKATEDPSLLAAVQNRTSNAFAMSPSIETFVFAPWGKQLEAGMVIKQRGDYFKVGDKASLTRVKHDDAIELLYRISESSQGLPYAFALAYLADEKVRLPAPALLQALQHSNIALRLAALYAAQKLPSHDFTQPLLLAWSKLKPRNALFATLQNRLFGEAERMLMSLSSHMALGRESTKAILSSLYLSDSEKAWLLQFRRDRTSIEYASRYLSHKDPIVRARAKYAMQKWRESEIKEL